MVETLDPGRAGVELGPRGARVGVWANDLRLWMWVHETDTVRETVREDGAEVENS
jgi:hypothetical protein